MLPAGQTPQNKTFDTTTKMVIARDFNTELQNYMWIWFLVPIENQT